MTSSDIYVCKESAMVPINGVPTLLSKGETRVRAGHELLKLYPQLFELIKVHYDVVEDTSTRTRDTGRTDARKAEPAAEAKPAAKKATPAAAKKAAAAKDKDE